MTVHLHPKTPLIPGYHPVTRWLHAALVLGVVFQLVCAAMMTHPEHEDAGFVAVVVAHAETVRADGYRPAHKNDAFGELLMAAHRTGGALVALIVLANLLWAIMARGKPRKRQFAVLFSAVHWSEAVSIAKRLPLMLMGRSPLPEPGNALSLIFEMLGLLTMAAMAFTGSIVWNMWAGPGSKVSELADFWMEIHAGIAVLLLLYLAGHVSMALLHMSSGDPVFARILPLEKKSR